MIPVFWCFATFCWYGQQLINESELLYTDFAECSWLNKPQWFKKNLAIILIRAKYPLKIMPLQLYTLNFNNMTTVSNILLCFYYY